MLPRALDVVFNSIGSKLSTKTRVRPVQFGDCITLTEEQATEAERQKIICVERSRMVRTEK